MRKSLQWKAIWYKKKWIVSQLLETGGVAAAKRLHYEPRVRKEAKRKIKIDSKRKQTFQYFFTVNEEKIKVCKAVFLKTLRIGEKTVAYILQQQEGFGHAA